MSVLDIAKGFSRFPAGRFVDDGPFPGETFRTMLVDALKKGPVTVVFDDTYGYGSSFLEEAFGGLVRKRHFTPAELRERMTLQTEDPSLLDEVWSYIDDASLGA